MRKFGVSVLVLITAGSGSIAPSLAAPSPAVRDGVPTARACAAYGYNSRPERDEMSRSYGSATMGAMPSPAPPPALAYTPQADRSKLGPPAMAIPALPQAGALESMVVTGSRMSPGFMPPPTDTFPGRERYPDARPNPVKQVSEEPVSTFSIDVDTASYANVRRFLKEGALPPADAVRVEEMVNYFDYDYPAAESRDQPFGTYVSVAPSPWAEGNQIIHVGLQGYELTRSEKPPLNLTFLVDVSGSMGPADRLPLAKQALNKLVDQLRPRDRVSMAVYAGAAGAVLPPTAGTDKLRIRCAIENLEAGGSTAGGEGLALAYRLARQTYSADRVNRVVLMTDGDFNVGVTSNRRLEDFVAEQRSTGVYLSVYGFGRGNYQDARMQTISQAGNGTAAYVDSLNEAGKLFDQDFSAQVFPIADDVKIQVEFNPARVREYRLIGYETRLLNREDFNNDQVDAGEVGAGASVTALYEITPVGIRGGVDPLRYQSEARPAPGSNELAFLRLRYKPKGGQASRLVERPITDRDRSGSLASAPAPTRLAISVAAFGQRLRHDPWMSRDFGWRDIGALAASAQGRDPYGVKSEFLQLVDQAAALGPRAELR
jgi:Ca-activated chloride channel family protein